MFPGGVIDRTDFSNEWLELISHQSLPLKTSMSNSTFYTSFTGLPANSLPAHIGFRICAIRETFEESGVLLVKPLTQDKNGVRQSTQHESINADKLDTWRNVIQKDASLFLQFCKYDHYEERSHNNFTTQSQKMPDIYI